MANSRKVTLRPLIRGAWDSTLGARTLFYTFVVLFVIAYSVDLLVPWAIGYTLGVFVEHGFTDEAMRLGMWGVAAYTGLRLLHTLLHHFGRYIQNMVAYTSRMNTYNRIFSSLISFPLRWHIGHHSGESLSKLHRSTGAIEAVIGTYVWQIIEGTVKVVVASIALFTLDFWVAVNVAVMSSITISAMVFFNSKVAAVIRENNTFGNRLNRIFVDYLVNIVSVKTLQLEGAANHHLDIQRDEGFRISKRISGLMELKWGSTSMGYALVIGSSLVIYFYDHRGLAKAIDIAQVYVLLNYLDRIFQAIGSFTGYDSGLIEASTAYEDATEIIEESERLSAHTNGVLLDPAWQTLHVNGLSFSYLSDEHRGLRDFSLDIRRHEKIAIVGPSGGGKSTFLKICAGLLVPEHYQLSTDVQQNLSFDHIAKQTLLIPQEPEIFSETIRYNLNMGEDFNSKELSFFISLCRLEELLAKLPHGWETNLAEKGLNLSVGEKQRVALARGLLRAKSRSLLLLDEPTSSLDPRTEKEIFHGLLYYFSDRAVITTCHRINLVPLFDRIVYVAQGAVQESGSFNELIARRGLFYRAWQDYTESEAKPELTSLSSISS